MADDWDLFAVVRSCTNSTATATAAAASTSSSTPDSSVKNREFGDPSINIPSFQHDDYPFYGVIDEKDDSFQGLEEIYKEFYSETRQSPNLSGSISGEFQNQLKIQVTKKQVQQHVQPQQMVQQRQNPHLQLRNPVLGSSLSFTSTSPQSVRPRRRKNQQSKVIHQMTQEELSTDSWAWRKYGQKPIKGSPYPRNYYRCSTSKGCSARKQVERCPTDPNIFVVSYSGEHTHPRPTHRSSLAGSTRSKLSTAAKPASTLTPTNMAAPITSSAAKPIMEGESEGEENNTDDGCTYNENDNAEMSGNIEIEEEEEEEDILIPNSFITDDILKGFEQISGGGTNGSDSSGAVADQSSCSLLSPPWTPTSSTTTTTNFPGGGGC